MALIVVTGCNRGIGLELCRQLATRGESVIGICREASAAVSALDVRIIDGIDVGDDATMPALREGVGNETIDVLINNAGILRGETFGAIDYDTMLEQYNVNALGPLRVTEALADKLAAGSKVVIVTSRVGSIEDNGSGGNYGYRASKTAVNQIGTNLKHEFLPRGVAVALLHPGLVATDMTRQTGVSVKDSAAGLIERIDELSLETSGGFWHAEGYRLPW